MRIDEWTYIGNLPLGIGYKFDYIRDEAEMLGDVDEDVVFDTVEMIFKRDFPKWFKRFEYDIVIDVEYQLFERDFTMDDDEFPGYAVYIHLHEDLVKALHEYVLEEYPEHALRYLHEIGY